MATPTDPGVGAEKECTTCGETKPIADFLTPDGRSHANKPNRCRACRTAHANAMNLNAGRKEARAELIAFTAEVNRRKTTQLSSIDLADGMLNQWQGLQGFCRGWFGQIQMAAAEKPGSKVVLDAYNAVARLVMAAAANQPSINDLELLTDAELEKKFVEQVTQLAPRLGSVEVESVEVDGHDHPAAGA